MSRILEHYARSLDWSSGVSKHNQAFKVLLRAASLGVCRSEAENFAAKMVLESGGCLSDRDIRHQADNAFSFTVGSNTSTESCSLSSNRLSGVLSTPKIEFEPALLQGVASRFRLNLNAEFFRDRSPSWPSGWKAYLNGLFLDSEHVNIFNDMTSLYPMNRKDLADESKIVGQKGGVWFQSNPVSGDWITYHENGIFRKTCRKAVCQTSFRHVVLESDEANPELWLKFLSVLPLRIVSIVTSGGKSIHALINIGAETKDEYDAIVKPCKPILTRFGADPASLTPVRLTRLPFSFREEKQQWQCLIYYNPNASGIPIVELKG